MNFELTTKFTYANKGEQVEAGWIELTAPTVKNAKECAALKQSFFRALPKADPVAVDQMSEAAPEPSDKEEMKGAEIMTILSMSKDVELHTVLLHGRELFNSGVAMIDGEIKLTKPLIDLMSMDDLENMTGEYLANFILASSLKTMKNL
jgi:hypothetical protein